MVALATSRSPRDISHVDLTAMAAILLLFLFYPLTQGGDISAVLPSYPALEKFLRDYRCPVNVLTPNSLEFEKLDRKVSQKKLFAEWRRLLVDPRLPLAASEDGRGFRLDQGGGLGDILGMAVSHMVRVVSQGYRPARPVVFASWPQSALMQDLGACTAAEARDGWACLFESNLTACSWPGASSEEAEHMSPQEVCESASGRSVENWQRLQGLMFRFIWQPTPFVAAHLKQARQALHWPPRDALGFPLPVIGVHVRRGDACFCDGENCHSNTDGAGRNCYPLSAYLKEALEYKAMYNIQHVYLATESADVVREVLKEWRRHFTLFVLDWDREGFQRVVKIPGKQGPSSLMRIEPLMINKALDAGQAVLSALVDLELLAECAALVRATSAFARTAASLGEGLRGYGVPCAHLDAPGRDKTQPCNN